MYTTTLGPQGVLIGTLLSDAQVNCSSVLPPTATPTPMPSATPTPVPDVCVFEDTSAFPGQPILTINFFFSGEVTWEWDDPWLAGIHIPEGEWGGVSRVGNQVALAATAEDDQGRTVRVVGRGTCQSGPGSFLAMRLRSLIFVRLIDGG